MLVQLLLLLLVHQLLLLLPLLLPGAAAPQSQFHSLPRRCLCQSRDTRGHTPGTGLGLLPCLARVPCCACPACCPCCASRRRQLARLRQPAEHVPLLGPYRQRLLAQALDAPADDVGGGEGEGRRLRRTRQVSLQVSL